MLSSLFGRGRAPTLKAVVGQDVRVYAIGDIHGRCDLLTDLHGFIAGDAAAHAASRNLIVYLGDYVDRGDDARGVVDSVLDATPAGFERVCLKGNHEALMLDFLDDAAQGPNWFYNGGLATLASYGVVAPSETGAIRIASLLQQRFRDALPERHLAFFRALAPYHKEGDYLFVHAGIKPGVPLDQQDPFDLIWIREAFLRNRDDHGFVVVHGHSIAPEVVDAGNRIGIDTGAYFTGVLTCLVLHGAERGLLQTGKAE